MSDASFLPDDYLNKQADRRTNLISLVLFGVVMIAVFAAFLVTNRQWSQVNETTRLINAQFAQKAKQIEQRDALQAQKKEMLHRAELAGALDEPVPRSVLLAELVKRMPARLGLLKFEMTSTREKPGRTATSGKTVGRLTGPGRAKTRQEASAEQKKIEPPKYLVSISMVGVAPTDVDVSRYIAELSAYELLWDVSLTSTEQKVIEDQTVRQFELSMKLDPTLDIRSMTPIDDRGDLRNPMNDEIQFGEQDWRKTATAPTDGSDGE